MKGHVDQERDRHPASYTITERLNMVADEVAEWAGANLHPSAPGAEAADMASH